MSKLLENARDACQRSGIFKVSIELHGIEKSKVNGADGLFRLSGC